jgi:hypothetical protein
VEAIVADAHAGHDLGDAAGSAERCRTLSLK